MVMTFRGASLLSTLVGISCWPKHHAMFRSTAEPLSDRDEEGAVPPIEDDDQALRAATACTNATGDGPS